MASPGIRSFHHCEFPLDKLLEAKGSRYVSVCLPARNEESTIGPIVATLCRELIGRRPLVDEVLVIDDRSGDATAEVARRSGAVVVPAAEVLVECGIGGGKGDALWKSLHACKGDLIVFCDADVRRFDHRFVTGLLGPLLLDGDIGFTKGFYRRPAAGPTGEGGRVTELVARPLISLFFPHLVPILQPLAGEYAGRRDVLEQVPFVRGYGVDLGLLIDVAARFGLDSIAQVDLGQRLHRNRSLEELGPQAMDILRVALDRAGVAVDPATSTALSRAGRDPAPIDMGERPPIIEVEAYRHMAASPLPDGAPSPSSSVGVGTPTPRPAVDRLS